MSGQLSTWQVGRWIADLAEGPNWVSLHLSNPFAAVDPGTTEPTGGYARDLTRFAGDGARSLANAEKAAWSGVDGCTVTWLGSFDAAAGGNLRFGLLLPTPLVILDGGFWELEAGQFYLYWA
jgi:hypothetical protein